MSSLPWQGIRIRIHFLFWVSILWSVLTGRFIEIVALFVLVIIHELGHLTAAWSHGWRVTALELLPFGGVARTDEWGTVPAREEIVVALAGPFHNVMMVLAGFLFYFFGLWTEEWTAFFVKGNAMLAGSICFRSIPWTEAGSCRAFSVMSFPIAAALTGLSREVWFFPRLAVSRSVRNGRGSASQSGDRLTLFVSCQLDGV